MIKLTDQELSELNLNDPFIQELLKIPIKEGRIEYVYKSKANKYPARIYLYMDCTKWPQRNRRVMGCMGVPAFADREMTRDENISCHFAYRIKYYQYEDIDALIDDEIKIVGEDHPIIKTLRELKDKNYFKALKPSQNKKQLSLL